jgi:hypothetical protein
VGKGAGSGTACVRIARRPPLVWRRRFGAKLVVCDGALRIGAAEEPAPRRHRGAGRVSHVRPGRAAAPEPKHAWHTRKPPGAGCAGRRFIQPRQPELTGAR